jgi:ribose transport system substrate-binding protein
MFTEVYLRISDFTVSRPLPVYDVRIVEGGAMKKLNLVVSLPHENTYQKEQAKAAKDAAAEVGAEVSILQASNDAVNQSQQLLEVVQSHDKPDAILFEPLTATALARVAEAAVSAGIAWVVLNCDVDYLAGLRSRAKVPVFSVTRDHTDIGRIQGRQFGALLPAGGTVLYIQGPATSSAAVQRTNGMESRKPANIKLKTLRSAWTDDAAHQAVSAWLKLSTSRAESIDVIGCQADAIAMGARKAFQEHADLTERQLWLKRPFTGIDGLPTEGQAWVDQGTLTATVVAGTTTRLAVQMIAKALGGGAQPPERTVIEAKSYPALENLAAIGEKGRE